MPVKLGIPPCSCKLPGQPFRTAVGRIVCSYCGGVIELHRDSYREPEKPGENEIFRCSCGRHEGLGYTCGELQVIPIKIGGEKRVDLRTIGMGGVVLSNKDRKALMAILADSDWFGV